MVKQNKKCSNKNNSWYSDNMFFLWQGDKDKLKSFIANINKVHPTIKFMVDW